MLLPLWLYDCGQPVYDYRKSLLDSWIYSIRSNHARVHWTPYIYDISDRVRTLRMYVCVCLCMTVSLCVCIAAVFRLFVPSLLLMRYSFFHFGVEMKKFTRISIRHVNIRRTLKTKSQQFSANCLKTRWILFHLSKSHEYRLNSFIHLFFFFRSIPFLLFNSLTSKDSLSTCEMNSHFSIWVCNCMYVCVCECRYAQVGAVVCWQRERFFCFFFGFERFRCGYKLIQW